MRTPRIMYFVVIVVDVAILVITAAMPTAARHPGRSVSTSTATGTRGTSDGDCCRATPSCGKFGSSWATGLPELGKTIWFVINDLII